MEGVTIPDYTDIESPDDEIIVIDKETTLEKLVTIPR